MTKLLTSLFILAIAGFLLVPPVADALPNGAVGYKVYHLEGSDWVRYRLGDEFPAGGATPPTNVWKYEYSVMNYGYATGVYQFMIFFNSDNILRATYSSSVAPTGWSYTYMPAAPGYYNWKVRFRTTQAMYYVMAPDTLPGYGVQFTWNDEAMLPGAQNYDLVAQTGSESGVTHELPPEMTPIEPSTWGAIKSLFR